MQRRFVMAGSVGLLLIAAAHAAGHFGPRPTDAAFQSAWRAMEGVTLSLGFGWRPSLVDVWQSQSLTMLVLVAALGAINLMAARAAAGTPLVRPIVVTSALAAGALSLANATHRVGLPAASFAVVAVLLTVAAARRRE